MLRTSKALPRALYIDAASTRIHRNPYMLYLFSSLFLVMVLEFLDLANNQCIKGRKTGHSGKVTCATTLYHHNLSDQLIKERTGHRSLEALHKYKRTGSDQQYEVSMALLPKLGKENIEKTPCLKNEDDDDPLKKPRTDDFKSLFKSSSFTFNIQLSKWQLCLCT